MAIDRNNQPFSPLPAPVLQTPPQGFLGFLNIKSGGKQPERLIDGLDCSINMEPYYDAGGRGVLAAGIVQAAATNLATTTNAILVPQGKVWIVEQIYAVSGAMGAASASEGWIIITGPGNIVYYAGPPSNPGVTGKIIACRADQRLVLLPGYSIRVFTSAVAAITAFNWTVSVSGAEVAA
jgi:hypothetical protein